MIAVTVDENATTETSITINWSVPVNDGCGTASAAECRDNAANYFSQTGGNNVAITGYTIRQVKVLDSWDVNSGAAITTADEDATTLDFVDVTSGTDVTYTTPNTAGITNAERWSFEIKAVTQVCPAGRTAAVEWSPRTTEVSGEKPPQMNAPSICVKEAGVCDIPTQLLRLRAVDAGQPAAKDQDIIVTW